MTDLPQKTLLMGLVMVGACACSAARPSIDTLRCSGVSEPLPQASELASVIGESSLVAPSVHAIELDGAAPSEALLTARTRDERSAVLALFSLRNRRWTLLAQRREPVADPGTFDASNGWAFEGALDAGGCRQHALLRFSNAQGAADPRSDQSSLDVLTLRGASIARTLRCPLTERTVMGPEREESVLLARTFERETPSSLVLRDESTRAIAARLRWSDEQWIESAPAGCDRGISPLAR